jgi:hypothetical protein
MKPNRTLSIAIFLFYLSIFTLIMGGHIYSPDEEIMYRTTESLVQFRGFAIEPIKPGGDRFTDRGWDGKYYGHYGLGQSLLAVPLYYASTLAIKVFPSEANVLFRANTIQYHEPDWNNHFRRFVISRYGQIITALTCLLLFHIGLVLGYSRRIALLLSLIYGLATIALPFSKTFYSEPTATLLLLLAFYNLFRYRATQRNSLLGWAGALLGYSVFTRVDTIIVIPIFLIYLYMIIRSNKSEPKNWLKKAIYFCLPLGLFCLLVGLFNYTRFGSMTHTGYESEGLSFSYPFLDGLYGLLMSAGKSIFIYTPPLLLFFPAIQKFWEEHKEEALFCCGLPLVYILFYSKWESWAGGWTWGARHVFQIHAFLLIPVLALLQHHLQRPTKVFWSTVAFIIGLGVFVQVPGILVSFMDYNYWFLQRQELYYTLYFPVHSSIAGHWEILSYNNVDLFFYWVWIKDGLVIFKVISIFFLLLTLGSGYFLLKRIR